MGPQTAHTPAKAGQDTKGLMARKHANRQDQQHGNVDMLVKQHCAVTQRHAE